MRYRLECPANRYVFKSRLNCSVMLLFVFAAAEVATNANLSSLISSVMHSYFLSFFQLTIPYTFSDCRIYSELIDVLHVVIVVGLCVVFIIPSQSICVYTHPVSTALSMVM